MKEKGFEQKKMVQNIIASIEEYIDNRFANAYIRRCLQN